MVLGRGCDPSLENVMTFSLEIGHFGANSVVYFNRNIRLFTARTMTVTAYCWQLTGPSYWGWFWGAFYRAKTITIKLDNF